MSEAFTITKERKKPWFRRQDLHKKRIKECWRKPKGINSKVRMKKRGYQAVVSIGYGTGAGRVIRDEKGLVARRVSSIKDVLSISPKQECALLSGTVGMKKRLAMLNEGKRKGIIFKGIDTEKEISRIESLFLKRTSEKKSRRRGAKERAAEREAKKKVELEKKISEEEKKEQEIKQAEKVLTKRES